MTVLVGKPSIEMSAQLHVKAGAAKTNSNEGGGMTIMGCQCSVRCSLQTAPSMVHATAGVQVVACG